MTFRCPKCEYTTTNNFSFESDRPDDKVKCLECGHIDTYESFILKSDYSLLKQRLNCETGVSEQDIDYIIKEYYKWRTQNGI